jgi:hypothetical protein
MTSTATWEFEAADPEVGFLSDTVTHTCDANEDAEPALIIDVRHHAGAHPELVAEVTTFECPVCTSTTTTTDQWPKHFFETPRDERDD